MSGENKKKPRRIRGYLAVGIVPVTVLLAIGVLPFAFSKTFGQIFFDSTTYGQILNSLWFYTELFVLTFVAITLLVNRKIKKEVYRRFNFVYGIFAGGIVANFIGAATVNTIERYLLFFPSLIPYATTAIIILSIFTPVSVVWLYDTRFREKPFEALMEGKVQHRILLGAAIILFLFIVGAVVINVFNYQFGFPFNWINPQSEGENIPFNFTYPPSNGTGGNTEVFSPGVTIQLYFNAISNTTIVNNQPLIITAAASVPYPMTKNVTFLSVAFQGSLRSEYGHPVPNVGDINLAAIELLPNVTRPYTGRYHENMTLTFSPGTNYTTSYQHIIFPGIGDYSPVVSIGLVVTNKTAVSLGLKNDTYVDYFSHVYTEDLLYVSSNEVLANDRYNRVNEVLTLTLVFFALIEGVKLIRDFDKAIKERSIRAKPQPPTPILLELDQEKSKEQNKSKSRENQEEEEKR